MGQSQEFIAKEYTYSGHVECGMLILSVNFPARGLPGSSSMDMEMSRLLCHHIHLRQSFPWRTLAFLPHRIRFWCQFSQEGSMSSPPSCVGSFIQYLGYVLGSKDAGILLLIYSKLKNGRFGNDSKMEIWTCQKFCIPPPFLRLSSNHFLRTSSFYYPSPSLPV